MTWLSSCSSGSSAGSPFGSSLSSLIRLRSQPTLPVGSSARPNCSPIELKAVDVVDRAAGLVRGSRCAAGRLLKAMSIAVRSAIPSWSASDCGSSASYRSGSIPSIRACAVSWATMSRDRLVWTILSFARNEKNWRLCEAAFVVGVGHPAGARDDEQLGRVEGPRDLATERVAAARTGTSSDRRSRTR